MKIRNGFISNSSSSSFIVKDKITTSYAMLLIVNLYKDAVYNVPKSITDFLNNNLNLDIPLLFPYGDQILIFKLKGKLFVQTSQRIVKLPFEKYKKYNEDCFTYMHDIVYFDISDKKFKSTLQHGEQRYCNYPEAKAFYNLLFYNGAINYTIIGTKQYKDHIIVKIKDGAYVSQWVLNEVKDE